ncbi:MAG TPA: hypothetical protein VIC33_16760 [Vicinamibacterales bacterium]|jgi:threonine/homoserine/homoserine lactone efflux protein
MAGPSITSVVAGIFVVAIVALLALVLAAPGVSTALQVIEGCLALFMVYVGLRVARDARSGKA